MSDLLVAARALHFASVATFAGLFLFLCFVGTPAFRACGGASARLRSRLREIGWISLALAVASGAAWFFLLALELSGRRAAFSDVPWTLLTETQFGNALLVRLGLAGLLSLALLRASPERGWRSRAGARFAAGLAACLIASLAWAGHAGGGSGTSGAIELVADALHLVAAAGWVGGLPSLLLVLAFARGTNDELSRAMAADAARRFSRLGLVSVSALLATGIVNTYFLAGGVPGLVGTEYGRLLLVKVALFAVMIAFAAANRLRLLPRLASPAARAAVLGRVERNGVAEFGLGLMVFVIVGALGTMPPAAHTQAWWPFALRLSTDAWFAPEHRLESAGILAAAILGTLAVLAAIPATRWRWPMAAAAVLALAWGGSRLNLITAEAFPTSFFVSPTGYSAHSIAAGRALFAEHCVSCHGEQGRGDGPAAQYLGPPPADLTAAHIYDHSDGDLFWWIANGVGEMPGFSAALDETARWNLIDFLHANADAMRLSAATDAAGLALPLPEFSLECDDGSVVSIGRLRGNVVHLVLAGPASAARLRQLAAARTEGEITIVVRLAGPQPSRLCSTADAEVVATFAVYRGGDEEIDGTEFLVDASGLLRAMWFPGRHPDWGKPEILAGEIAAIRHAPGRPRPSAGAGAHAHSH